MKEIKQLLAITKSLKKQYENKLDFSLDGKLVGDIGEALVSGKFDIELYGKNAKDYDGCHRKTEKKVQIKASMAYNFSYPFGKDLEHYIAVHIETDGELEILYNGPGKPIHNFLKSSDRKLKRNSLVSIAPSHLRKLYEKVAEYDRLS